MPCYYNNLLGRIIFLKDIGYPVSSLPVTHGRFVVTTTYQNVLPDALVWPYVLLFYLQI